MVEQLKYQFKYFYKKVFKKEYLFSVNDNKFIVNFYKLLKSEYNDSVGEEWIFEYLLFQFNKFSTAKTKILVQLNWIYGNKALNNYRKRNKEADYFKKKFRKEFNIKRRVVLSKTPILLSNSYKVNEKFRFEDKSRQFLHCVELMLFDSNTKECRECKFYKNCNNGGI